MAPSFFHTSRAAFFIKKSDLYLLILTEEIIVTLYNRLSNTIQAIVTINLHTYTFSLKNVLHFNCRIGFL